MHIDRFTPYINRRVCAGPAMGYHPILGGIEIRLTLHPLGDSSPLRTEISSVKLSFVKILGLNRGVGGCARPKILKKCMNLNWKGGWGS